MEFQLLSFRLDENYFGIDIKKVREIMKLMPITKLPSSAPFLRGVINVRGKIVPVIDTRMKIGMEHQEATKESRLLLVEKEEKVVGLLVDEVSEVMTISEEDIEPLNNTEADVGYSSVITGIIKLDNQMIMLLDIDHLI